MACKVTYNGTRFDSIDKMKAAIQKSANSDLVKLLQNKLNDDISTGKISQLEANKIFDRAGVAKAVEKMKNVEALNAVHKAAEDAEMDIDTPAFKSKSKELTGVEHLDDMTPEQLGVMKNYLNEQQAKQNQGTEQAEKAEPGKTEATETGKPTGESQEESAKPEPGKAPIEPGKEYTVEEFAKLMDFGNKFVQKIFEKVGKVASKLGVTITLHDEASPGKGAGVYDRSTNKITLYLPTIRESYETQVAGKGRGKGVFLGTKGITDFSKFFTYIVAHEVIHGATTRALAHVQENSQTGTYKGPLSPAQVAAVYKLNAIHNHLKSLDQEKVFGGREYGLENFHELLAEMSNEGFVDTLRGIQLPGELRYSSQSKNVFDSIINYIRQLFTGQTQPHNAADSLFGVLSDIMQMPPIETAKTETDDSKNKTGVSSEVGERQEPVETKPEQRGGEAQAAPEIISDKQYNDFVDKNIVSDAILQSIADKVKNQQPLSLRETAIFHAKTGEVNSIIVSQAKQRTPAEHVKYIKDQFRKQFKAKGIPDQEIDAAIALMDARAKSWASEKKGRTPEQWYGRIADIRGGELETDDLMYQFLGNSDFKKNIFGKITGVKDSVLKEIKDEMDAIERNARRDGKWMKAPNGNYSNLSAFQWKLVRTKRFKQWFGDWRRDPKNASKILDANGEPQVYYSGTGMEFDEFNKDFFYSGEGAMFYGAGFYFTPNKTTAQGYSVQSVTNAVISKIVKHYNETANEITKLQAGIPQKGHVDDFKKGIAKVQAKVDEYVKELDKQIAAEKSKEVRYTLMDIRDALDLASYKIREEAKVADNKYILERHKYQYNFSGNIEKILNDANTKVGEKLQNRREIGAGQGHVFQTFLNVRKPMSWEGEPTDWFRKHVKDNLAKKGISLDTSKFKTVGEMYVAVAEALGEPMIPKLQVRQYKKTSDFFESIGIDGIIHTTHTNWARGTYFRQEAGEKQIIVFNPKDIKSAVGNVGTFSRETANIKYQQSLTSANAIFETRDGRPIGFNYNTDQVARERFDLSKLKVIGKGSDRTVFDLGDGRVLKVAHTARGLDQNIYEGDNYLAGIVPHVYERGLNYVVAENIPRMKASDMVDVYDVDGNVTGQAKASEMIKDLGTLSPKDYENNTKKAQDVLYKYGLQDVTSYDILARDFDAIRNWGYRDGTPYHIDGGTFGGVKMIEEHRGKKPLSNAEFRDIYNRSRALKKQYQDRDKFTKFQEATPTATAKQVQLPDGRKVTAVTMPEVVNGFYSPLEKILLETKAEKLPAKQWLDRFGRSEEAKWTGLTDWLQKQEGSVSKAAIQQFMQDNRIQVSEIEVPKKKTALARYGDREKLVEDGGRNYKEILVTLPPQRKPKQEAELESYLDELRDKYGQDFKGSQLTDTEIDKLQALKSAARVDEDAKFQSSHYDEPNILVHLRMNTRTDADGKKVLFLEEVQSDWGQKGKKEGFAPSESRIKAEKELKELEDKKAALDKEWDDIAAEMEAKGLPPGASTSEVNNFLRGRTPEYYKLERQLDTVRNNRDWDAIQKRMKEIEDEHAEIDRRRNRIAYDRVVVTKKVNAQKTQVQIEQKFDKKRIQPAPFVMDTNAWTKLGLKVALKEAVKQGADRIAWTTGEQQNARYDLKKKIDGLVYQKNTDGTFDVDIIHKGTGLPAVDKKGLTLAQVEANYGKDVANRMAEDVGDNYKYENVNEGNIAESVRIDGRIAADVIYEMEDSGKDSAGYLDSAVRQAAKAGGNKQAGIDWLKGAAKKWGEKGETKRVDAINEALDIFNNAEIKFNEGGAKVLRGDNLSVGGKGMKGFYGSMEEGKLGIVGEQAKSLFKQAPKAITIEIKGEINRSISDDQIMDNLERVSKDEAEDILADLHDERWIYTVDSGEPFRIRSASDLEGVNPKNIYAVEMRESSKKQQHSIEITPELRRQAQEGQPLFQKPKDGGPKGAMETLADGRVVIHALNAPDVSTMVHEIFHVFEGDLEDSEREEFAKWSNTEVGSTEYHEALARGGERYLRDGKAPTEALKPLFEKFKQWLTNIYKTLKGSPIEKKISPEIRKIFDRLLTEQQAPAQPEAVKTAPVAPKEGDHLIVISKTDKKPINYIYRNGGWHFINSQGKFLKETPTSQERLNKEFIKQQGGEVAEAPAQATAAPATQAAPAQTPAQEAQTYKGIIANLTPYAGQRLQRYRYLNTMIDWLMRKGKKKEAKAYADEMRSDMEYRLKKLLPGTEFKIINTRGVWQGGGEPSVRIHFPVVNDDVYAALAKLGAEFDQDAIHTLEVLPTDFQSDNVGVEDAEGFINIPMTFIELSKPITPEDLDQLFKESGIGGGNLSADGKTIGIYDDTAYENGDVALEGHRIFAAKEKKLHDGLRNKGISTNAQANFGRFRAFKREGQTGSGKTYGWADSNLRKSESYKEREAKDGDHKEWARRSLTNPIRKAVEAVSAISPKIKNQDHPEHQRLLNIGHLFDKMAIYDDHPKVVKAYQTLAKVLKHQYRTLPIRVYPHGKPVLKDGKVEWVLNTKDTAYPSSKDMMRDVDRNNKMIFYVTTPEGFGSDPTKDYSTHPLLKNTGFYTTPMQVVDKDGNPLYKKDQWGNDVPWMEGYQMKYNDLLRVVHDYIAHAASGAEFGARGEDRAWAAHVASVMADPQFTDQEKFETIQALTSETRGQNTWVNFISERNKVVNPLLDQKRRETDEDAKAAIQKKIDDLDGMEFSEQKVGLLPLEALQGGYPETTEADQFVRDYAAKHGAYVSEQSEANRKKQKTAAEYQAQLEGKKTTEEASTPAPAEEELPQATVKIHERPEMEYPVYEVKIGDKVQYIQRSTNADNIPLWSRVEKDKYGWSQAGEHEGFLGWTKAEAIRSLQQDAAAEQQAPAPAVEETPTPTPTETAAPEAAPETTTAAPAETEVPPAETKAPPADLSLDDMLKGLGNIRNGLPPIPGSLQLPGEETAETKAFKKELKTGLKYFVGKEPNALEVAEKLLPKDIFNRYKAMYEMAARNGVFVNVGKGNLGHVYGYNVIASWGDGAVQLDPDISARASRDWNDFAETLNHEIIHGLLNYGISNRYGLQSRLAPIMKQVQQSYDKAPDDVKGIIEYIMDTSKSYPKVSDYEGATMEELENETMKKTSDLEELITYAFTNKAFAEFLDSIPATEALPKGQKNSIFSQLKEIVRDLFKKMAGKGTALDEINSVLDEYFDSAFREKDFTERNEKYGWGYSLTAKGMAMPGEGSVERLADYLKGKDIKEIAKSIGVDENWDMAGEGDWLGGKEGSVAYTQRQLPDWNYHSMRGNINPESKLTYDIIRGSKPRMMTLSNGTTIDIGGSRDNKKVVTARDENGVTIGIVELEDNGGIQHLAVAPEFRGRGVAKQLIAELKKHNPKLDLTKTKLRSEGFEKAIAPLAIAEAYYKAKEDGSNPDLVSAVENVLPAVPESLQLPGEGIDREAEKAWADAIRDKIEAEVKAGRMSREQADKIYDKANIRQPGAKVTPPPIGKRVDLTPDEEREMMLHLGREITEAEFPSIFSENAIAKQEAAVTQGAGQDRVVDGMYVRAMNNDLEAVSTQISRTLQERFKEGWEAKVLSFMEKYPNVGNPAIKVGVLNILSTSVFNQLNETTNKKEVAALTDAQRRLDAVTLRLAREASLTMRQRQLYAAFARAIPVKQVLQQTVLSKEQQDFMMKVQQMDKEPVTPEQLNTIPDEAPPPSQQEIKKRRQRRKKAADDKKAADAKPKKSRKGNADIHNDLKTKGASAAETFDESGKKEKKSFKDIIRELKDRLDKLDC